MKVFLTGATGFIGGHLMDHFAATGIDARPIARPAIPLEYSALLDAFRGVHTVVHLAGLISTIDDREYGKVNVDATRSVARAARDAGARLVHISSLAAAGPAPASNPRVESDPPNPLTPYGRSKLEGERVVSAIDGLRWTILRPGVVYGPRDRALFTLFRFAARGILPIVGRRSAAYTFIHVSDVVRAIAAAIDREADGEVMFVGHPRPVTTLDVLEGIRAAVGRPAALVPVPSAVMPIAVAIAEFAEVIIKRPLPLNRWRHAELTAEGFVCRVDRLRDTLGVTAAIDLRQGLGQTADWYRRQGWL
jgi:nucleoside-diphosphate-sugar epimerase